MLITILLVMMTVAALCTLMVVGTPEIKGISTIVWGTQGKLGSPLGAIVDSLDITPKNPTGLGEIENGDGAGVADVLLDDGFDAKVSCTEDTAKSWPDIGDAVVLTIPKRNGSGTQAYTCYVPGDPEGRYQRKKEGMRIINLKYRPGIAA